MLVILAFLCTTKESTWLFIEHEKDTPYRKAYELCAGILVVYFENICFFNIRIDSGNTVGGQTLEDVIYLCLLHYVISSEK